VTPQQQRAARGVHRYANAARHSGLVALFIAVVLILPATAHATAGNTKTACVYAFHHIRILEHFESKVGRKFDCALVYNDAAPDWSGWEDPWFTHHPDPDLNWAKWATAPDTRRQLIITQNLFPSSVNNSDWLHHGARGDYVQHAKALARHLVTSGLGGSVIRLAHEANGTTYPYSVGTTATELRLWKQFWRQTAKAMRSVPGAHFRFDWTVNAGWRPIPFRDFYPGNDVVDIIGIDAYDSGVRGRANRWRTIYNRPGGVLDAIRFARAHHRPLSIPEWGVGPRGRSSLAGGDDPSYVDGIARVVRNNRVAYQSYFYAHEWGRQLARGRRSLRSYRKHFGAHGDSLSLGRRR
jgi:hypothetical protein